MEMKYDEGTIFGKFPKTGTPIFLENQHSKSYLSLGIEHWIFCISGKYATAVKYIFLTHLKLIWPKAIGIRLGRLYSVNKDLPTLLDMCSE